MSPFRRRTILGFARRLMLVTLVPIAASAAEMHTALPASRLDDVVVAPRGENTVIQLRTSRPTTYRTELVDSPARLVVDLEDTTFAWLGGPLDAVTAPLKQIRGSQYRKGTARIVVEFVERASYAVTETSGGLSILVSREPAEVATTTASPRDHSRRAVMAAHRGGEATSVASLPTPGFLAAQTDLSKGMTPPAGETPSDPMRVAQTPPPPPRPPAPPSTTNGRLISLDFKDADVVNLLRILAAETTKNIVISDDVKGKMSITLRNVPWEQALDIILQSRGLQKIEQGNVIRIVTTEQLARERTAAAQLEDARIKAEQIRLTADAELRAKAAEAQRKEQEALQLVDLRARQQAEQQARGPLVEDTIKLAYADAEDVAKTLQGLLGITGTEAAAPAAAPIVPPAGPPFSALYGAGTQTPSPAAPTSELLAKGVTIQAHKPTNSIFIRYYANDLERIKKLIRETLDIQLPQIKIEARLSELSRTDLFDIGVQWGGGAVGRAGSNVLVTQGTQPFTALTPANTTSPGTFSSTAINPNINPTGVTPVAGNPLSGFLPVLPAGAAAGLAPLIGNLVNLPAAGPVGGIGFGIIGGRFSLNLALTALEQQTKARSLSRPEIVTVENVKASIQLGSDIPFATVSSAGTQVQFRAAVLSLEVTPSVIREPNQTKIKMKVVITNDSQGDPVPSGSSGGFLPTINKRTANTSVVVKEGETLVIGGINQRTDTETTRKVPLFGDIPLLGWLFKAKTFATNPNRELIVFITPTVLTDAPAGTGPTAPPAAPPPPPSR